jgi:lipopolysaccharide export system permease protein
MFTAFVLGLLTFNFILITERVLRLTKVFASVGASLPDMLRILVLMQPQITVLTTPIAFLIAVLLTYGRIGADSELVILRSSGMSFRQISRPVFLFGVGCFLLTLAASFYAAPLGAKRLRQTVSQIISTRAPLAVEEGIFNTSFKGVVVYVNERTDDGELKDIFIYDERRSGEPTVLLARSGRIDVSGGGSGINFDLHDGRIHMTGEKGATELSFGRYMLSFPITITDSPLKSLPELTPLGLLKTASHKTGKERTRTLLELHRRLSLPFLCLILMVLGPPLSLMAGKSGKLGGLAIGILVFALYYATVVYTEGLAMADKIPHWLGAWGPAIAFSVVSAMMFRRASSR